MTSIRSDTPVRLARSLNGYRGIIRVVDMHVLSLRIDPELYERLRTTAFERRVSQSAIIRDGLAAELARIDSEAAGTDAS